MSGDSDLGVVIPNIKPIVPIVHVVPTASTAFSGSQGIATFPMNSTAPAPSSSAVSGPIPMVSTDFIVSDYNEKSFVVRGDKTKEYRGNLQNAGGKWRPNLNNAWAFYNDKKDAVLHLIDEIRGGRVAVMQPPPKKPRFQPMQQQSSPYQQNAYQSYQPAPYASPMAMMGQQPMVQPMLVPGQVSIGSPVGHGHQQMVQWSVYRPSFGMKAQVTMTQNHVRLELNIVNMENDQMGNVTIVHAVDQATGAAYIIGIWNGEWQIRGVLDAHKIFFKN